MPRKQATSGFIYLWYDRKHKRYYLGKHWGTIDDGYICSSVWMRNAYKRRPQDFKRRILEWVNTNKFDLNEKERNWGILIKNHEYGTRYYNLNPPGGNQWHDSSDKSKDIGSKISKSLKGKPLSEEHKAKISKTMLQSRCQSIIKGRPKSAEAKKKVSEGLKRGYAEGRIISPTQGKLVPEETRRKISETLKKKFASGELTPPSKHR